MRKKYLSALLFGALVMASTVTFTSCIDNDEPAGIENLRGAKAELLRAKVAVEQAEAAYRLAQAETEKADAALTLAKAEIKKQVAEQQKLANEIQAARNEEEKARLQAAIEATNAQLEQNKLTWQTTLLTLKTQLAQAEKAYEDAMKALELSKGMISDAEASQLAWAQGKLNAAKTALSTAHSTLTSEYTNYYNAVAKPDNYFSEAAIESLIADKKLEATEAKNELSLKLEALNALKSGDAYTAWENLKASYQAKLDSLDQVIADKTNKKNAIIAEFQNAEIKDLQTAVDKITTYINDGDYTVSEKDSTFTVSAAIKSIIDGATAAHGSNIFIAYDNASGKYTAKFKNTKGMTLYKNDESDLADNTSAAAAYATLLDNTYAFDARDNSDYTKAVKEIEAVVKALGELKGNINPNQPAYAEEIVAEKKKDMDAAKTAADEAIKAWKEAKDAYLSADGTSYDATQFTVDRAGLSALLGGTVNDDNKAAVYATFVAFKNNMTKYNSVPFTDASVTAITGADDLKNTTKKSALKTFVDSYNTFRAVDKAQVLLTAATVAFGSQGTYQGKGVLVQPTDDAIKAVASYGTTCGAQGFYLSTVAAYNEAVDQKNMAGKYDEAIAQLNAWKAALATQKASYMASEKVTKLIKAVTDAQAAVTEKVATPIKELGLEADKDMQKLIKDIKDSFVNANGEIKEFNTIISGLESQIGVPADPTTSPAVTATGLYRTIANAEEAVLRAEKLLEVYKSGNWSNQDAITWAEEELQRAKDAYNAAVAEFNYWNGKVAALLNTLYGSAAE